MKRSLLFLLVAFTLAVAMVPKHRPQDTEDIAAVTDSKFCADQTPCAWSIYKSGFKNLIEMNITNTYCICTSDQYCAWSHEDESASTYVYLCASKS